MDGCSDRSLGDNQSSVNEAVVHNLTTEALADSLNVEIDVAADWEKASEGASFGKNQKEYKEIKGETISISYRASEYTPITEGGWLDAIASLKKRLDSIGEPYALGYGINDPHLVVVRMSPEKLTDGIIKSLCVDGIEFRAGYTTASVPTSYGSKNYVELTEADSTPAVKINSFYDTDKELYSKLFEAAALKGDDKVWLTDADSTMRFLVAEKTDEDYLIFTCPDNMEKYSSWLPAFTASLYENKLGIFFSFEAYSFSEEDGAVPAGYLAAETRQAIEADYPVRVIEADGLNLKIILDFPVNENLPQTMVTEAKKLYELIDFENSDFDTLSLYFINEMDEERARVFFSKHYKTMYSSSELESGYAYTYGIFKGGRIERDKEVFMALLAEDEFFQSLNHEADGNVYFD